MFVLIRSLILLVSLLASGTTQEFNGYFNAAAGGNSDDAWMNNTAFRLF